MDRSSAGTEVKRGDEAVLKSQRNTQEKMKITGNVNIGRRDGGGWRWVTERKSLGDVYVFFAGTI